MPSDASLHKFLRPFQVANDPVLKHMRSRAESYIWELRQLPPVRRPSGRWITFIGNNGTGKTLLAKCIHAAWPYLYVEPSTRATLSRTGNFEHWPKFVRDMRSGKYNISLAVADLLDWPFLVVDEIGADRDNSGFAADLLCQVVTGRLRKPTVWTSNLTLDQLDRIDRRITSRFIRDGNEVVECNTMDWALR